MSYTPTPEEDAERARFSPDTATMLRWACARTLSRQLPKPVIGHPAVAHSLVQRPGEGPQEAFERYCAIPHERKGKTFKLTFIGAIEEGGAL